MNKTKVFITKECKEEGSERCPYNIDSFPDIFSLPNRFTINHEGNFVATYSRYINVPLSGRTRHIKKNTELWKKIHDELKRLKFSVLYAIIESNGKMMARGHEDDYHPLTCLKKQEE
jgi:hypothetical protein